MVTGFCWGLFWHCGSLALGALFIYVGWIFHITFGPLYYTFKEKFEKMEEGCLKKTIRPLFRLYDTVLYYANPHAHIYVVLYSFSFSKASQHAAKQMVTYTKMGRNYLSLTEILLVFGVLAISVVVTLAAKYLVVAFEFFSHSIVLSGSPMIFSFILSFIISLFFIHLPISAVDVAAHCSLLKEEPLLKKNEQPLNTNTP